MSDHRRDVAVVTGAGSGIGAATALSLLRTGHLVVGVDRDAAGLEQTAVDASTDADRFHALRGDVSDDDVCAEAVATAAAAGRLKVLVNCAGVMPADDHVEKLAPEIWDRTFAVNVRPIYLLARHGLAHLRADGGVIVNVASVHAYASSPGTSAYAATKGAIVALTQQLALDLAVDGVRVVAVAPGSVDTPMSTRAAERAGVGSVVDLGFPSNPRAACRVGRAVEVAEVISWLTTPAASFVNGTTVRVDGALLAGIPTPGGGGSGTAGTRPRTGSVARPGSTQSGGPDEDH